jgi:hypothetical protein
MLMSASSKPHWHECQGKEWVVVGA